MTSEIEAEVREYFEANWKNVCHDEIRRKLFEEVGELKAAILFSTASSVAEEAADVVIVLCSLLRELYGISLMTEVSDKLAILKERSKNN